ncbi:MAG: protein-export chaperone SecB, partial [Alphaproteobacteria bacterium]
PHHGDHRVGGVELETPRRRQADPPEVALDLAAEGGARAVTHQIEAPRQLFPFARAIIADAVRDGGFPPLLVQPIDFMSLYQQRVAQMQAEGGEAAAPAAAGNGAGDKKDGDDKQKFEFEL